MKSLKRISTIAAGVVLSASTVTAMAGPSEQWRVTANSIPQSSPSPSAMAENSVKTTGFQKYVSHRYNKSLPEETAEFAAFEKSKDKKKRDHLYYRRDRSI